MTEEPKRLKFSSPLVMLGMLAVMMSIPAALSVFFEKKDEKQR